MTTEQGDLRLLEEPVAQELLQAPFPARLAYVWPDGTPRVVPIWFHWNGEEIVMSGLPNAPRSHVLKDGMRVAITIDTNDFPNKVLMLRGPVAAEVVDGITPEYAASAKRCMGAEGGQAFLDMASTFTKQSVRLRVKPDWVGLLDFQTRFPSAVAASMGG